jgi:hypothetical protein
MNTFHLHPFHLIIEPLFLLLLFRLRVFCRYASRAFNLSVYFNRFFDFLLGFFAILFLFVFVIDFTLCLSLGSVALATGFRNSF